jgi:predicted nucleic acid-binding protein
MAVVVDANLVVVLNAPDPRRPAVRDLFDRWREADETLHAPDLILYEVANALTGLLVAGKLSEAMTQEAWRSVTTLPITLSPLADGPKVIELAVKLRRRSAYDAAYIALAVELGTQVWTLDGPLARNASATGLPVRLVGGEATP